MCSGIFFFLTCFAVLIRFLGFLRADVQPQPLLQPVLRCVKQLYCALVTAGEDFEVIRVSNTGYFLQFASPQGREFVSLVRRAIRIGVHLERIPGRDFLPLAG